MLSKTISENLTDKIISFRSQVFGSTKELPKPVAEKISSLASAQQKWHELSDSDRANVARKCRGQLATLDFDWVPDNQRCLGIEPSSRDKGKSASMEPFVFVTTIATRLDKIVDKLEGKVKAEEKQKNLNKESPTESRKFSIEGVQGIRGLNCELWADQSGPETQPSSADKPGVGVVMGAGNQNMLTVVDVLELAFKHKKCVLLKMHPLREFMAAPFGHVLQPLMAAGAFDQCLDSELSGAHSALMTHPSVVHVHLTGSDETHNKIHAALVEAGRDKEVLFTSELGSVTPWIICPGKANDGKWTDKSINDHATMLASAFSANCSMNCLSPKVLVLPSEEVWPDRKRFIEALHKKIAAQHMPPPYYPGAHKRYKAFEAEYPDAIKIDAVPCQEEGVALGTSQYAHLGQVLAPLPALVFDVGTIGSKDCRQYALQNEAFAPVLAIATVSCESAAEFPLAAAKAVNEHVFGSLSCTVIYPDDRDEVLEKMIETLNYGCVAVNFWTALMYSNPLAVWGGAPGSYSPSDPQSGLGLIGNAAGIPRVRKAVGITTFENKDVIMGTPIPYMIADALTLLISGKKYAGWRILGMILRRGFGLIPKQVPGSSRMCFSDNSRPGSSEPLSPDCAAS
jgi:acyl-CoA reductase-like NAD-dependent aldehyde dehydrogenase